PRLWRTTRRLLASIRFLAHQPHEVTERGAFKDYIGSTELNADLRFLEDPPEPGDTGLALLTLTEPAVLDWHDRFVLRDAGRGETLGGGVVLEAHPQEIRRRQPFAMLAERATRRAAVSDRAASFLVVLEEEGNLPVPDVAPPPGAGRRTSSWPCAAKPRPPRRSWRSSAGASMPPSFAGSSGPASSSRSARTSSSRRRPWPGSATSSSSGSPPVGPSRSPSSG